MQKILERVCAIDAMDTNEGICDMIGGEKCEICFIDC